MMLARLKANTDASFQAAIKAAESDKVLLSDEYLRQEALQAALANSRFYLVLYLMCLMRMVFDVFDVFDVFAAFVVVSVTRLFCGVCLVYFLLYLTPSPTHPPTVGMSPFVSSFPCHVELLNVLFEQLCWTFYFHVFDVLAVL